MRLTETLRAGGATAPAAMLLATARAAMLLATARAERADGANPRITALEFELALLERDVGLPEHTKAGNRAEPV